MRFFTIVRTRTRNTRWRTTSRNRRVSVLGTYARGIRLTRKKLGQGVGVKRIGLHLRRRNCSHPVSSSSTCLPLDMTFSPRRHSERLRADGKGPVEIRIEINTGEVVMRSIGRGSSHAQYLPAGHVVGLASRLQTIAPTGAIAVSEHTRGLVEGYFQLK